MLINYHLKRTNTVLVGFKKSNEFLFLFFFILIIIFSIIIIIIIIVVILSC